MAQDEETESPETRREGRGTIAQPAPPLAKGDVIGRFVVKGTIGRGGMGVVYAATDPELGRSVALKLVRPGGGSESQARLLREAQAMARLSHPNVVAIYDVGVYRKRVFFAMELVVGDTVRRWLKQAPRSWREVLAVFRGAGRGLAAAHAAGIVHRDFKLDNVLVDGDGRARVTDFGLARAVDESGEAEPPSDDAVSPSLEAPLTQTGAVVGTPAYMAPEQRTPSTPADARADEFSFCVSLYEALYGERPFDPDGNVRPAPTGRRVPAWIRRILLRGLANDPAERWPSMSGLLDALDRDPRVRRVRIAIASAAVVAILGTAFVTTRSRRAETCDDSEAAFGDVWSPVHRDAVQRAFVGTGKPYAERGFATVTAALDRTASAWKSARTEACRATRERHEASEEQMLLRMACLERQRTELRVLVELLATADGRMVEGSGQVAARLARPAECDDARSVAVAAKLPDNPAVRQEIETLRMQLANANPLAYVGRPSDAIARYEPIARRAKEIGFRPLQAEASFALGLAQAAQGNPAQALDAFQDATFAADAGHLDRLAALVALRAAAMYAVESRFPEAETALARGRAMIERSGGDRELEGELAFTEGIIALNAGRQADAVAAFERALPIRTEILGPDHYDTLRIHTNLGASLDELARGKEAIAHDLAAIQGFERTLGPEHPILIVPNANLGLVYLRLGDIAKAEPFLKRANELGLRTVGPSNYRTAVSELFMSRLALETEHVD
ncbi:MAG TPA: serine/threonine-protein kinase, partial [Kofleriaceae bacterium]|nr:serine/threonine-protein kinase [Kofleriaceae bacterium]